MSESLCGDCKAREVKYLPDPAGGVDYIRMRPNRRDDKRAVAALPGGGDINEALALERPERCARLKELLPAVHAKTGHAMLMGCPEVMVVELVLLQQAHDERGEQAG